MDMFYEVPIIILLNNLEPAIHSVWFFDTGSNDFVLVKRLIPYLTRRQLYVFMRALSLIKGLCPIL